MSEPWTILKLLQWSQSYFADKGITSARLDSELLLAHSLNLKRMDLYLQFERILTPVELTQYKAYVKRRAAQEPIAYITGKKEFWSHEFMVSPAVLIPRGDTEVLVEVVLDCLGAQQLVPEGYAAPLRAFEMGLGSGAIAITLLAEIPTLQMTAIDISADAITVASANAAKHSVSERLQVLNEDFLKIITTDRFERFDFIVANPPYISETEFAILDATVKDFEPRMALVAEDDGLKYYHALAEFAKSHLQQNGFIAVEIGDTQGLAVAEIFRNAGFENVVVKKDYAGQDRVVVGRIIK